MDLFEREQNVAGSNPVGGVFCLKQIKCSEDHDVISVKWYRGVRAANYV